MLRRLAAGASCPAVLLYGLLSAPGPYAAEESAAIDPNAERIEITATRIPEQVEMVPYAMTIIPGADLRARGARDLRGALALATGIDVAPGGDGGPAGSVPEIWGLREFDAFLLVVDGVPWGGVFSPALTTLDLTDVERIEVLKGPAPVMYGATSFVGVIHVIHNAPGSGGTMAGAGAGSYGGGSVFGSAPLPPRGRLESTLIGDVERRSYRDDRTEAERGHLAWRGALAGAGGVLGLRADGTWLRQDPASPHPRVGEDLTTDVPLDANHNPGDARVNEQRVQLAATFDRPWSRGTWSSIASVVGSSGSALRGFLTDVSASPPNANGVDQTSDATEVYIDTHMTLTAGRRIHAVWGLDHMHGRGTVRGGDFGYTADLDGDTAPDVSGIPRDSDIRQRDRRDYSGLYAQVETFPTDRWRLQAGARLNRTSEVRRVHVSDRIASTSDTSSDSRVVTRGSGSAGVTWTAWRHGADSLRLFGSYSVTYKPAVVDFDFDAEADILQPETADSVQIGGRTRLAGGKYEMEISAFQMNFENLVVSQATMGLPELTNAGSERFRGIEIDSDWRIRPDLWLRTTYSLHDARFRDFLTEFDGTPARLRGNRLEMSARNLASAGLVYAPSHGWAASTGVHYVGSRYLNKRNTALAPWYATWSAGVAYRGRGWEVRLDGTNLNNQRPPVSESEIGDAQYYLLPARRFELRFIRSFG